MVQIGLPRIEVVLILSRVVTAIAKRQKVNCLSGKTSGKGRTHLCLASISNLLFLDDLCHLMEESDLHVLIALLGLSKEYQTSLVVPSKYPLNDAAAPQDLVVIPLNLEHPPVLLDVNRSQTLLVSPLLGLTTSISRLSSLNRAELSPDNFSYH